MVKTPNVRHSKPRRTPVTIELEASRLADSAADLKAGEDTNPEKKAEPQKESPPKQPSSAQSSSGASAQGSATSDPKPAASAGASSSAGGGSGFGRDAGNTSRSSPPPAQPRRGGTSALAAGIIGAVVALAGAGALQYAGVLPGLSAGTADDAGLQSLSQQVADLQAKVESQPAATADPGVAQSVADLGARLDKLSGDLDSLREAAQAGGQGDGAALAALQDRIAVVEGKVGQTDANADLAPLKEAVAALETAVKSATDSAGAADQKIAALEQSVAALTAKVEAQASQPKIALSIAASALKAAIERGQSFASELDTLAAISPGLPQIEALRAHAAAGVATQEGLVAEMGAAADAMIAAAKPVDPDAGYFDQLLESASSLVSVRPVGAVAGAGVPETVARMEAAVKAGDLAKALAEYDSLPEPAKQAGADYAARVKARLEVGKLADEAIAEAMKSV